MWICCHRLHDCGPVQVERTLGKGDIHRIEPLFHVIQRLHGYGVDVVGRAREVLEHEDQIEVLETELYTFEVSNFNLFECDDHERRFGELHETVRGRLAEDVGAEWNTIETNLAERDVHIKVLVLACFSNLLSESLELAIEVGTTATLFLFGLELLFISVAVFAFAVTGFIKLDVSSFAKELNVFCLLLADQDGIFEVHVNNDNQFVVAGLEKQVLDVAEKNVDFLC